MQWCAAVVRDTALVAIFAGQHFIVSLAAIAGFASCFVSSEQADCFGE